MPFDLLNRPSRRALACATVFTTSALLATTARAGVPSAPPVTTFDGGVTNGWQVFGTNEEGQGDFLEPDGGNPGAHLRFFQIDTFFVNFRNDTNAGYLGDYGRYEFGVRLGVDVKADSITFGGTEVSRDVVVELVDLNPPGSDYPYVSVFYNLGTINAAQGAFQELSIDIADTQSLTLPAGWGGTGAENPVTFEPELPAGRTFASVLASVDEVRFTTAVPGFFYGFTNFALRYDNVTVAALPEPTTLAALAGVMAVAGRRRRSV